MDIKYIFDVDGTITPSRGTMDREFRRWFSKFAERKEVYLVTGSDRDKTIEQVGEVVYNRAKKVYQCGGNDVWIGDSQISSNKFVLKDDLKTVLLEEVKRSKFYRKGFQNIEERSGLVNFSIPGRPCGLETRAMYRQWDEHKHERQDIVFRLREQFDEYDFKIAGETGIDITSIGFNKSQILKDFDKRDVIWFFGDKTSPDGNDHEIAVAVGDRSGSNRSFTIQSWRHTWNILKQHDDK